MSIDKKRHLMRVYIREGYTAAKPLAIKYGIRPKTISKYAKAMGHEGRRGREPGIWKGVKPKLDERADAVLWQRAIDRGAISI